MHLWKKTTAFPCQYVQKKKEKKNETDFLQNLTLNWGTAELWMLSETTVQIVT